MKQDDIFPEFATSLEDILREGARKLLQQAIKNEVAEHIERYKNLKDQSSRQMVKRNGYLPQRQIQTGLGAVEIKQPRVRGSRFSSVILPKYLRRVPSLERLIPVLYLKGVSTGNMEEALSAILGKNA